ncbi:MAG TPA: alpha/beta fold hydrolase [Solirubrobacteraceae bacterium]|nr:alpha/beta fold hydrolase [Solirubrobacteraceae bacterium]
MAEETQRTVRRSISGLSVTERVHDVPLDHFDPAGERIEVFSREIADPDHMDRPLLVYFEGGPGYESPRPSRTTKSPAWIDRALKDFRVLLLDQRGTGRSTPIGPSFADSAQEQADYLANFRADSIVADAELIRTELDVERWSLLGQSFGGFCSVRYLSCAPESLREVLITGGLPPLGAAIDDVYRETYASMRTRSERFYARYPDDRERMGRLVERLRERPLQTPDGESLGPDRLRGLGHVLGMADGAEVLHYLLELDPNSQAFLHDAMALTPFSRNPIYAVLHEACWADGGSTRWAAERMLAELGEWAPEHFTGEHVLPWVFEDLSALAPLRDAAELIATREWPALYDASRLEANEVPVAALVYAEDVYVPRRFSEETAARVRGLRPWLTNEYDHDGLVRDSDRVLGRLLDLARDRI